MLELLDWEKSIRNKIKSSNKRSQLTSTVVTELITVEEIEEGLSDWQ